MDYKLKKAYEQVCSNNKQPALKITNLTEAYSYGVLQKDTFFTEAVLKNTSKASSLIKYLNNLNELLKKRFPDPLKYETNKLEIVDFIPVSGQEIPINPEYTLEDLKNLIKNTTLKGTIGGTPTTVVVAKLVKTSAIKGGSTNRGDIIEGVLAAAIFARLTTEKNQIDFADVEEVIESLKIISPITESLVVEARAKKDKPKKPKSSTKAQLQMSVKGEGDTIDNFSLHITLKRESMESLLDIKTMRMFIGSRFNSILAYVNEEVSQFAKDYRTNRQIDYVKVIADGVSQNTATKVDVSMKFVTYDKDNTEVERDVEHFQLSIKTNKADLIGQKAGGGKLTRFEQLEILYSFWAEILPEPFQTHLKNSLIQTHKFNQPEVLESLSQLEMYQTVYAEAFNVFRELLEKGNKEIVPQETFKLLLENLKTIATGGQKTVKLVQFEEKEYFVLNFDQIYDWIDNNYLQLIAKIKISDRGLPTIYIYGQYKNVLEAQSTPSLSNKEELLFKIRVFAQKEEVAVNTDSTKVGYIRNYIEKGPLLVKMVKQQKKFVDSPPENQ